MDSIGVLGRVGRLFSPSQPKSVPPEAESERDRVGFKDTVQKRAERLREAVEAGGVSPRRAAHIRDNLENRTDDIRDRLDPFRERVAQAVDRIEQRAQNRVERLQAALESGRLEPETLQARLTERFGDRASDVVNEDGALDADRVQDLFARVGLRHLRERIDAFREGREPDSEPALDPEAAPEPGSVISIEA